MVNLTQLFADAPVLTNWIGKLIYLLYQNIGNFGWTVVIFTICLKALVSPLDIWQKSVTRKNNKAMRRMQPEIEKLQKKYEGDPQMIQRKQMELYKANGYSMVGACLPSLLTIVIFFIVFSGFNAAVRFENQTIVYDLTTSYKELVLDTDLINGNVDALYEVENAEALAQIKEYGVDPASFGNEGVYTEEDVDNLIDSIMFSAYKDHSVTDKGVNKWRWLWIKNLFMPDSWQDVVPSLETYVGSGLGKLNSTLPDTNFQVRAKYNGNVYKALLGPAMNAYNKTKTFDLANWNGYLILPILSIILSVLSTKLMRGNQPQQPTQYDAQGRPVNTQGTMKMMNWMMPIMIGVFSLFYSAAFSIYMFTNSLITVLINLVYNGITTRKDKLEEANNVR